MRTLYMYCEECHDTSYLPEGETVCPHCDKMDCLFEADGDYEEIYSEYSNNTNVLETWLNSDEHNTE